MVADRRKKGKGWSAWEKKKKDMHQILQMRKTITRYAEKNRGKYPPRAKASEEGGRGSHYSNFFQIGGRP